MILRKFSIPVTDRMNKLTESTILETLASAKKKGLLVRGIVPEETALHLIALINGIYRLYFVGFDFLMNKENSVKIINDYINLLI